jgi:guanosine-3',5'-bis(diphosphate) 3'-pyrophosphohydrolase
MIAEATALQFATHWHRRQTRKGLHREPFVHHPMRVSHRLLSHGLNDTALLSAALLHDILEDTDCPPEQLTRSFGPEVSGIVQELTDDKYLLKSLRKQYQVERAPLLSLKARLIRLADKIDNVESLITDPPASWNLQRKRDYVAWARRVVNAIRGTHPGLEADFDRISTRVWKQLTGSEE